MAASIVQQAKNSTAYQVNPLNVTLPAKTTAGSRVVVVVEAQKSGYPFASGSIVSNTPAPIVTDDQGTTYTLVDNFVGLSQDVPVDSGGTGVQPDAAGYYPSAYIYISSTTVTGAQNVYVAAFYPDAIVSPVHSINGRPVFDGGLHAQAFEVAGLSTGVDVHAHTTVVGGTVTSPPTSNPLGASIVTSTAAGIIFEVGILIDSSTLISNANSIQQFSQILYGGTTHFVVQSRITTGVTANGGFGNALFYTGGVVAVGLK